MLFRAHESREFREDMHLAFYNIGTTKVVFIYRHRRLRPRQRNNVYLVGDGEWGEWNVHVLRPKTSADRLILTYRLLFMAHTSIVSCLVSIERRHPVDVYGAPIIQGNRACEI